MAKSPTEWRSEWRDYFDILGKMLPRRSMREYVRQEMSNCVLGYAMARGWYHV